MKSLQLYDDRQVMIALNNACVALTRWTKLQEPLRDHPTRLRSFSEGIVDMVREAVTVTVAGRGGSVDKTISLTDPEIALTLMVATLMSVFDSDMLPEDSPMRSFFAGSLVKVRNKREQGEEKNVDTKS